MEFLDTQISDLHTSNQAVPLPALIPQIPKNGFFYKNGLSKVIPRLTLKVHTDMEECYELWEKFSPKNSMFDLWDFRYSWYQAYDEKTYFYTLYENKTPIALLPLCYSKDEHGKWRFAWFGTDWMEDNTFFVKDEHYIDLLLAVAPAPLFLNVIKKTGDWSKFLVEGSLKVDDPKYTKDISSFTSIDDYLGVLKKKYRHTLKADYLYTLGLNPKIVVSETLDDDMFKKFVAMNIAQFDRLNDKSDFEDPDRVETVRNIVKNRGVYKTKFVQIYIQNRLAGIDFMTTYKDTYYTVRASIDMNRFRSISNFMVYYEFEEAIKSGYSLVDCLQGDYGWKHRYFDRIDGYCIEK